MPHTPDVDMDVLVPIGPAIAPEEREQRIHNIGKFYEHQRASRIAEQLKARLNYATFKVTHGFTAIPLSKLDAHIDQQLAARSPSPSQVSIASSQHSVSTTHQGGRKIAAKPKRQSFNAVAPPIPPPPPERRVPTSLSALSVSCSPDLDAFAFPQPPQPGQGAGSGALYAALFGSQGPIAGMPASFLPPEKLSPTIAFPEPSQQYTNGRKRAFNVSSLTVAGSLPPPESPRKHRRTASSASFSHPPRAHTVQEEAANAAAILTSFLSSQDSRSSQDTKVDGASQQSRTYVGRQSSQQSHASMSRTSSASSVGFGIQAPRPRSSLSQQQNHARPVTPPRGPDQDADAAETLVYLATSPSPARSARHPSSSVSSLSAAAGRVLFAPSTPLRSSNNSHNPDNLRTPHGFLMSDFVNVSPSPGFVTTPFRTAGGVEEGRGLTGLQPPASGIF